MTRATLLTSGLLVLASMTYPVTGATTVAYELGVGGGPSNYWSSWKAGSYVAYVHGDPNPGILWYQGFMVNWDVVVTCSGTTSDGYQALGLANIVFNLELREGTAENGALAAAAKYTSLINDGSVRTDIPGGVRNPFEKVAFAEGWAIDADYDGVMDRSCPTDGPGRLYDVVGSAGPYMNRVQFGSTATHGGGRMSDGQASYFGDCNANLQKDYDEINAAGGVNGVGGTLDTNNNGVIDACEAGVPLAGVPAATLLGTGIGYTQFTAANPENLSPGGNVVGVGIATPFLEEVTFAYTVGLGARVAVEGQIDLSAVPQGTYTLWLKVPTANAEPPNKIGQNVITGGYTFYPAASAGGFAVKADNVTEDSVTFVPVGVPPYPPDIVSWRSIKTHGSIGPCAIALDDTDGKATSEPRKNGVTKIEIVFTDDASASYNAANVTVTPAPASLTKTLSGDGRTLTLDMTGPDKTCYLINLTGAANFVVGADTTCSVANFYCNASDEWAGIPKSVDLGDMLTVKSRISAQQITCDKARYDVNCDGYVDLADLLITKSKISAQTVTCP